MMTSTIEAAHIQGRLERSLGSRKDHTTFSFTKPIVTAKHIDESELALLRAKFGRIIKNG